MDVDLTCKCTALLSWAACRRAARRWPRALSLIVILLATAPGVRADVELGHEGKTGRHRLADMYDSPGAVCDIVLPGPDSLGETWIRVNPPVMFARDRTAGRDEQTVGWRVSIAALDEETGVWRVVRRSETARAVASDDLASYFDGQGRLAAFPLGGATYAATVEMLWYDPTDSSRVEGKATHAVEHYSVILRYDDEVTHGRTSSLCRAPR